MIVFPRKGAKPKDFSQSDIVSSVGTALPIARLADGISEIKKSDLPAPIEGGAYTALRKARSDARLRGVREKRAKEKAEAESAKK